MTCHCFSPTQRKVCMLRGNWLLTGGSGFLCRAIIRRADREGWPCQFTVFSRDEEKHWKLRRRWPDIQCVIGDVRDYDRLEPTMAGQDGVIHAAAIKFVPEAEFNVAETIAVNIEGSRAVARAAVRQGVSRVIGISTDKACLPVNVYGMTKALMERLLCEANAWSADTQFNVVRYGNVVGSTGSVIPIFQHQKETQRRLTLTDKNMTRFWLSPDGAVDVILKALEEKQGGTVIVPRCGAMTMHNLALLVADGCPIDIVGARPGEKAHEDLIHFRESVRAWQDGNYYRLEPVSEPPGEHELFTYSSQAPAHWIEPEQMALMIEDAATL